jgi:muconate cycloisomerase
VTHSEYQHERIATVEVIPTAVPFRAAFNIARGSVGSEQNTGSVAFVRIETSSGAVGWGEQRSLPSWSYETLESITSTIRNYFAPILIGRSPFDLNAIHRDMSKAITPAVSNGMPFARAAIDIALHDVAGKISGLPIHALLGGKLRDTQELCWAIGVDEPDVMAETASQWNHGFCFKVKVGGDPELDARRIDAVRSAAPDMPLWLDANQSYRPAAATMLFELLRETPNIRSFEQPTESVDWLGMGRIREKCPYPVAIDEGCFSSYDLARVVKLGVADQVVLKVCKAGGLQNARNSAQIAIANGMGILGSGLTDCGVAFTAAVHLFSTLELDLPAELNGPQFLDGMLVDGLELDGAIVRVPDGPGLGVAVDEAAIRSNAVDVS